VEAQVSQVGKVLQGELTRVLRPSPSRRTPPCGLYERCGGCDLLHLEEAEQQKARVEMVLSTLEHLGGIARDSFTLQPMVKARQALGYRRRAELRFGRGRLGFFGRGSHEHVEVEECPALVPLLARLPRQLSDALGIVSKEIDSVEVLAEGEQAAIAINVKTVAKPRVVEVVEKAVRSLSLAGAVIVPKTGAAPVVGRPTLRSYSPLTPEVPLYLRPEAFAQVSAEGNVGLVTSAVVALGAGETDSVLELYSGNGNFTFAVAGTAREVVAVESSRVAVELAQRSAREARQVKVRLIQGDVDKVCQGLASEGRRFDLLLLDPPRTGAPRVHEWARAFSPRKIVYVACDPASLARDATRLGKAGYRPMTLQIVDLFPQTRHVESVMTFGDRLLFR
jgi:23S rRNA (uracil1939-C5)-methyltransferase